MGNIQQSLMETRSNLPAPTAPRLNFVSVLAFVAPVALGALTTLWTLNPGGAIVGVLLGLLEPALAQIERSPNDGDAGFGWRLTHGRRR